MECTLGTQVDSDDDIIDDVTTNTSLAGVTADHTHPAVQRANDVRRGGYPNVYGARIPASSKWSCDTLQDLLKNYDDKEIVEFLKFGWPANRLPNAPKPIVTHKNHESAVMHKNYIFEYIQSELDAGSLIGPFHTIPFTNRVGVSPLSTREKKDGYSRRTIMDLSYPKGGSVNDHIPKNSYLGIKISLVYPTVDDLAKQLKKLGRGALMWKRDLKRWFRQIPLDPMDVELFGFTWEGLYYFDLVLVMGHRAAPYIAQRITNALNHIHTCTGFFLLNYIDDFIGAEVGQKAWDSYHKMADLLHKVGAEESTSKAVDPNPVVEFLGVLFNAQAQTMSVTPERLQELKELTESWLNSNTGSFTRKQLESLIGKLQFVAACVRPGRVFISRLLNKLRGLNSTGNYDMDSQVLKDMYWWYKFLPTYNGVSILWPEQCLNPDQCIASDASGVGAGGICWGVGYFRVRFPQHLKNTNIAHLEMWGVIISIRVWGHRLRGKKVVIKCDNDSVCHVVNHGRSRDLFLQAAMREIVFLCATYELEVRCQHISGVSNRIPDHLSRWWARDRGTHRRKFREYSQDSSLKRVYIQSSMFKFTHDW